MNLLPCQIFWHRRLIRCWYLGCKLSRIKMSLDRFFTLEIFMYIFLMKPHCLYRMQVNMEAKVFLWRNYFYSTAWVDWTAMNSLKDIYIYSIYILNEEKATEPYLTMMGKGANLLTGVKQWLFNSNVSQKSSDSVSPEWGSKICFSNTSTGNYAAGLRITLWEPLE